MLIEPCFGVIYAIAIVIPITFLEICFFIYVIVVSLFIKRPMGFTLYSKRRKVDF